MCKSGGTYRESEGEEGGDVGILAFGPDQLLLGGASAFRCCWGVRVVGLL